MLTLEHGPQTARVEFDLFQRTIFTEEQRATLTSVLVIFIRPLASQSESSDEKHVSRHGHVQNKMTYIKTQSETQQELTAQLPPDRDLI